MFVGVNVEVYQGGALLLSLGRKISPKRSLSLASLSGTHELSRFLSQADTKYKGQEPEKRPGIPLPSIDGES